MFKDHGRIQLQWALGVALLVALLVTGVALADYITVNTDDGVLDSAWAGRSIFINDPSGDNTGTAQYDLLEIFMGESGTNPTDYFYFLVQVNANNFTTVLNIAANLDCDNDGNFVEADDRRVLYSGGAVFVQSGLGANIRGNVSTDGERVSFAGGTNNAAEFRVPLGDVDTCGTNPTIGVLFATIEAPLPGTVRDTTLPRLWDVPTAIDLVSVEGRSASNLPLILAAVGAVLLLGLSLVLRRRRA
jgi:hypothetical protein